MNYVHVSHSQMLALFVGVEEEQPFRHQPSVLLLVDFWEYKQFVLQVVRSKKPWMYLPLEQYEKAVTLSGNDMLLRNLYYYDMSRAMLFEALLSSNLGRESTLLGTGFSLDSDICVVCLANARVLAVESAAYSKAIVSAKKDMGEIPLKGELSGRNKQILDYALFLRTLAFERNPKAYELKV